MFNATANTNNQPSAQHPQPQTCIRDESCNWDDEDVAAGSSNAQPQQKDDVGNWDWDADEAVNENTKALQDLALLDPNRLLPKGISTAQGGQPELSDWFDKGRPKAPLTELMYAPGTRGNPVGSTPMAGLVRPPNGPVVDPGKDYVLKFQREINETIDKVYFGKLLSTQAQLKVCLRCT
jgi:hypothetical protein